MDKCGMQTQDIFRLEGMGGGEYSAAAGAVAFVRTVYGQDGARSSCLTLLDTRSGAERTLPVQGPREPHFSPDGKRLSVLSGGGLWLYELSTGHGEKLTDACGGASGVQWSPKGDALLFCAADAEEREKVRPHDDAVAITDFGYKFDGMGFVSMTRQHIYTVTVEGVQTQLTAGDWDDLFPVWTPDGETVVFISGRARSKQDAIGADLFTVPAAGGEIKRISKLGSVVRYPIPFRPLVTPDGKYAVAAYLPEDPKDTRHERGLPLSRLLAAALDGSGDRDIFETEGEAYECVAFPYNISGARCPDRAALSSDGRRVLFLSGKNGETLLYQAGLYGAPRVTQLRADGDSCIGVGKPQGGVLLAAIAGREKPAEYCLIDENTGRTVKRLTDANAFLSKRTVCLPQELWFDTLDGGGRVQGWVIPPAGLREGERCPAILYIHGGPHPYYTPCFDMELQCLASAGFAVLYSNPRGSSGYGAKHLDARLATDGTAYTDLLQFVDEACRRFSFIDPRRIGATGGSYGGYMVNFMATHSKRFGCYVSQRGIANELISYACSDMQGSSAQYEAFVDFMRAKLESSAVVRAQDVSAPMLIMHGTEDLRCPVEDAHQWFVALKDTHASLPVKMLLWPHVSHGQPERPAQLVRYYDEMIAWFRKYL